MRFLDTDTKVEDAKSTCSKNLCELGSSLSFYITNTLKSPIRDGSYAVVYHFHQLDGQRVSPFRRHLKAFFRRFLPREISLIPMPFSNFTWGKLSFFVEILAVRIVKNVSFLPARNFFGFIPWRLQHEFRNYIVLHANLRGGDAIRPHF